MRLSSPAFQDGGRIPPKFTCQGEDASPELLLSGVPPGTKSIALIMDDPDAPMGTWVHWVVWGMDPLKTVLPESARGLGIDGYNSFGGPGYLGPCPPPGKPHRYFFKAYALDRELELRPGSGKAALESAMEGHILAKAELMGTYGR